MEIVTSIASIIPAYNEARNINSLLAVLREVSIIGEIIVVDDGSLDDTAKRIQESAGLDPRIRFIPHRKNLGKGQAILTGRSATNASILLLLDADLRGITARQIISLIEPVLHGNVDMTLGLFRGGQFLTDFAHWGAPWLTGQRALKSFLLDDVNVNAANGYGFETALTLAASRMGWRTQVVWLQGVWHPPSEFHRGLLYGISQRARMYFHIARAWHTAGGYSILWKRSKKWILSLLILCAILSTYEMISAYYAAGTPNEFSGLSLLDITGFKRILVIAPHPDDETLGAGGVIQQALEDGSRVKVVVVTNGDGQRFAPVVFDEKLKPQPQDYIAMGERRQAESATALETLGIRSSDMIFLGYPDRGIDPMWLADWRSQCPYLSIFTRVVKNPYPDTYDVGDAYCGKNLLDDLQNIINAYRPDLILLPHPSDQHPDHGAVSDFARMAIAMVSVKDKSYKPEQWGYIVHYGMFPEPRGKHFDKVLVPPKNLFKNNSHWGRVMLSPGTVSLKYSAIQDYTSQVLLLGQFLPSFARSNELYEPLPLSVQPLVSFSTLPIFDYDVIEDIDSGLPYTSNEEYPVKGNMFTSWEAARLNNILRLNLDVRRGILPGLKCILLLKLPNGKTHQVVLGTDGTFFSSRVFWTQINLTDLGNPSVIAFAAEIKQEGVIISKTGWHILILQ